MVSATLEGAKVLIDEPSTSGNSKTENLTEHQRRSILLRQELHLFKAYVSENKNSASLWIPDFKKILEREPAATEHKDNDFGPINSLWNVAKTCSGITAFRQNHEIFGRTEMRSRKEEGHVNNTTKVDVVCQNGAKWIRVYNLTAKKAFWAFANAGYGGAESDSSGSDTEDEDTNDPTGLLRISKALISAARLTTHRSRHPSITIVLPRFHMRDLDEIKIGDPRLILNVFDRVRALGVTLQTSSDMKYPPLTPDIMRRMIRPDFSTFTSRINIDTTILLALVSDISHAQVEPQDWHHSMISLQIEKELGLQLLPEHIWPACGAREMVCTREAAKVMQSIVDDIATETERERAALLFERPGKVLSQAERVKEFQKFSQYLVPRDWSLPIRVVDIDLEALKDAIPETGKSAADILSLHNGKQSIENNPVNACVFLYGWSEGIITITSNAAARRSVEGVVLASEDRVGLNGPDIWCLPYPRSLVGKEKYKKVA